MKSEWIETTLESLLTFSNGRACPKRVDSAPYQVFGANGAIGRCHEFNAGPNTIIIGRVGSCGSVHFASEPCWVTDNAIRAEAKGNNDPYFLFYLLRSLDLNNWRSGSGQPLLTQSALTTLRVTVPVPRIQAQIGAMLQLLDSRINLLREISTIMEAIARAIFGSWFIDFDPVRAKAEGREPDGMDPQTKALFPDTFQDSELGPIPKGWRVESLGNVFHLNPRRDLAKGTVATYLDMQNTPTIGHRPSCLRKREFGSGVKFSNGDTLLARITPCLENGKTAYVDFLQEGEVGWGSTEFIVLRPKPPLPPFFGYLLARDPRFRAYAINSMSGSSGRQRVDVRSLAQYKLVVPDAAVAEAFGRVVEPLRARIAANSEMQATLAALRDTLLPRLISGKLRVPEAEQALKEVL